MHAFSDAPKSLNHQILFSAVPGKERSDFRLPGLFLRVGTCSVAFAFYGSRIGIPVPEGGELVSLEPS